MTSPIIPRLLYQDVSVVPVAGAVSVYVTGPFQDGDCLGPNQTWAISNHLTWEKLTHTLWPNDHNCDQMTTVILCLWPSDNSDSLFMIKYNQCHVPTVDVHNKLYCSL